MDFGKLNNIIQTKTIQPRGYSGFQVTGMIQSGQKSKPQKHPRASNRTEKNPWTKN